jgi:signal transduction histidine kinase
MLLGGSSPARPTSSRFVEHPLVRAILTPAGIAATITGLILVPLFLMTATATTDVGFFENLHWSVACIGAAIVALLGARDATPGRERIVRGFLALSVVGWALGQIAFDIEAVDGIPPTPSISDVFFVLTLVPAGIAVAQGLRGRLSGRERIATYLDGATLMFAVTAILLALTSDDLAAAGGHSLWLALLPTLFFGIAGVGFVGALATRAELAPRGPFAVMLGQLIVGATYMFWLDDSIAGVNPSGAGFNYLFSIGLLVLAIGAATWTERKTESERYERAARRLLMVLPLVAVATVSVLIVLNERVVHHATQPLFLAGCALAVATTVVRQFILLRERDSIVAELGNQQLSLKVALAEREVALQGREAATVALEARAALLERVLAASEALRLDALEEGAQRLFATVMPPGIEGVMTRLDPVTGRFSPLARHGPIGEAIIHAHRTFADLPAEAREGMLAGRPGAFRRSDPSAIPAGFKAVVPDLIPGVTADAMLAFPVVDRTGQLIGRVLLVQREGESLLDPFLVGVVRLVADITRSAIENQNLHEALRAQLGEMERVQERLIFAAKLGAIGELSGAVAHEVNNPLTGVLGYAELLLADLGADAPGRAELEVIRSEALRARSVVRSLVEVARPRPPSRVSTDLSKLIRSTLDLLRYHVERAGVRIDEHYDDLPELELDQGAIQQALLHVLTNAIQAMPDGGVLRIDARRERHEAILLIADTGVGMTDDVRRQAFMPFYTTRDPASGSGLGLAVSLNLVTGHGGTLELASTPGAGTTVEMRLPIAAEPRRRQQARRPAGGVSARGRRRQTAVAGAPSRPAIRPDETAGATAR